MAELRANINKGLAIRSEANIKVRQPLSSITIPKNDFDFREIIKEELNVKEIDYGNSINLDTEITIKLKEEGLIRELIRHIQSARKKADLSVDDRIFLAVNIKEDKGLGSAIKNFSDLIEQETLSELKTNEELNNHFSQKLKIEDNSVIISLKKK